MREVWPIGLAPIGNRPSDVMTNKPVKAHDWRRRPKPPTWNCFIADCQGERSALSFCFGGSLTLGVLAEVAKGEGYTKRFRRVIGYSERRE